MKFWILWSENLVGQFWTAPFFHKIRKDVGQQIIVGKRTLTQNVFEQKKILILFQINVANNCPTFFWGGAKKDSFYLLNTVKTIYRKNLNKSNMRRGNIWLHHHYLTFIDMYVFMEIFWRYVKASKITPPLYSLQE